MMFLRRIMMDGIIFFELQKELIKIEKIWPSKVSLYDASSVNDEK